jgi:L-asparaginase/Glu-tRNA(Gln) amidotransferase subunit D
MLFFFGDKTGFEAFLVKTGENKPVILVSAQTYTAAYGNDASYHNQYSTVDVYQDGRKYQIAIAGNGGSKSYVLSSTLP